MNPFLNAVMEQAVQRTMEALRRNNMEPYYLATAAEVAPFVEAMLPTGCTVGCGGSMTLEETGVHALLAGGRYHYLDRSTTPPDRMEELFRQCFSADWYLTSANAITQQGELYNVDGNSNRVAAIAFGPRNVLVIAGVNKLVPDLAAADARVKAVAAPANALRLGRKTPCTVTGKCENCRSADRICCNTLISGQQRVPGRIKVLLVGEPLGF